MPTFLRGWRRRAGCVTLVMALALTGEWIRGLWVEDTFHTYTKRREWFAVLTNGSFIFASLYFDEDDSLQPNPEIPFWMSSWRSKEGFVPTDTLMADHWKHKWCGFWYGVDKWSLGMMVPFWSVVAPLTALSAYLLLSKPRTTPKST